MKETAPNTGNGPHGCLLSNSFVRITDHPNMPIAIAVSGIGSGPALATCETCQILLAGVPGGFSRGVLPFLPHLLIGPSHMSKGR